MARRLGQTVNEMIINDSVSGSEITFYYRMPSNKERAAYHGNLFNLRGGNRLQMKAFETQLEFGAKILTGFKDGDFEIEKNGKWAPISSQPESPNFYAAWREYLVEQAPDLITALATAVFSNAMAQSPDEREAEASEERKNSQSYSRDSTGLNA